MPISESQLQTWSHQGATVSSRDTYATVKRALQASGTGYAAMQPDIFLQGSYGNDTNVYADSDVDVVVLVDRTFHYDIDQLTERQRDSFQADTPPATYHYPQYKQDVITSLQRAFGSDVVPGHKAIAIRASGNRRSADVIPAFQFKRYYSYGPADTTSFISGIAFFTSDSRLIDNFPKQHSTNLTAKHQATGGRLKPMVRIFKNLRNSLIELPEGVAPSYFIEGLLYNVPNGRFVGSRQDQCAQIIDWSLHADTSKLLCANEAYFLIRDGEHNCWPTASFQAFKNAVVARWSRG
jgi:hypothetical protein